MTNQKDLIPFSQYKLMTIRKIGLLTSFTPEILKSEYFVRIMSGIISGLRQGPHELRFILVRDEDYANDSRKILKEHAVDGIALLTWRIHPKFIKEAEEIHLPLVIINDFVPDMTANVVYCNNKIGMKYAFNHLLSRGYKRIGMLQGPDEASLDARERYQAYRDLMKEYNLEFESSYYRKCDYFFEEDGYLKMMDIIENSKNLPRAVFCFNDEIAIGAIRALKESWIKCPEQVAIVGYDGIERGKYVDPPLTTVRQPLESMGREMVNILLSIIEGKERGPIQKEMVPELVIRQST